MFHTILNYYDVFRNNNDMAIREAKDLGGIKADVYKYGGAEYVDRIYSTDPYDYLDPNVYPFSEVRDRNRPRG